MLSIVGTVFYVIFVIFLGVVMVPLGIIVGTDGPWSEYTESLKELRVSLIPLRFAYYLTA